MQAVCLLIAGVLRATLPTQTFTLEWTHSIEKIQWRESYAVLGDRLALTGARVEGMGAGMEAGDGATFDGSGWRWKPSIAPLPEIILTLSPYTSDYRLCAGASCRSLHAWAEVAPTTTAAVTVRPCAARSAAK